MQFEKRKLADLRPAEYNPRKRLTPDDPEYIQIKNSLQEFGYADPIVINTDGTIIKGHQRRNVMIDLGYTEAEDVADLRRWHERGLIDRVDFFVGEIFQRSYPDVYAAVREFISECGGRLVIFRNHSKVMAIAGERFDCLIESSANINTNPRSENTVVTVDRELTAKYIQLFSEIVPFNRDYGAEPYSGETTP